MMPRTSRNVARLIAFPSVLMALSAASGREEAEAPAKTAKPYWRDVFAAHEVIQRVRPKESLGYVPNPHRGTATFQRFNGDPLYPGTRWNDRIGPAEFKPFSGNANNERYPQTTISYCRWVWAVIEPEKGKYRWDIIDGALKAARERGQTLQVRLQPIIRYADVPKFYWEMGGTDLRGRGRRREIDHNNPAYLRHWGDLIRAFGERYDGHSHLESFDMAYGGSCGETGGNCTDQTAEKLIDIYLESFKKTRLIAMLGTHGSEYAMKKAPGRIGWRVDCFGDVHTEGGGDVPDGKNWNHMEDAYPKSLAECGARDAWRTAPVILETGWTVPHWRAKGWDLDWILEQGLRYHASVFMPKSCYIPDEWKEKIAEFDRKLGYRFVLRQVTMPLEARPGDGIEMLVFVDNAGCAPIYRRYRLAYRFRQGGRAEIVRSTQDIRAWMPDEPTWFRDRIELPATLEPGEVKVDIGIVGGTRDEVQVRFAVDGLLEDGWYPMSSMDVLPGK